MFGNKQLARILFFIANAVPTDDEYDEAEKIRGNVSFRNANFVPAEGALEQCDGVAGAVPERYAAKFPDAAEAIKRKDAERKAALKDTGDRLAPVVGTGEGGEQKTGQTPGSRPAWPGAQGNSGDKP